MIKTINKFLNKDELKLAEEYWLIKEPSLPICNQCPNSVSTYADVLSETFLKIKKHLVEKSINEKLIPTYSFSRMYYKGGLLAKHSDRPSCEVSVTLNIISDKNWKIWFHKLKNNRKIDTNVKPVSLITKPGDAAVYEGCEYEHWREPYEGEKCMQVFLHYVRANGKYKNFAFDGRNNFGQNKEEAFKNLWSK